MHKLWSRIHWPNLSWNWTCKADLCQPFLREIWPKEHLIMINIIRFFFKLTQNPCLVFNSIKGAEVFNKSFQWVSNIHTGAYLFWTATESNTILQYNTVKCHYNACHYNGNASLTRSILGSQTTHTCPHDHPWVAQHMGKGVKSSGLIVHSGNDIPLFPYKWNKTKVSHLLVMSIQ